MSNDELYEKAVEAITALFSDTSVSKSETAQSLNDLKGEIDVMLDALEE
jgi:hypothetical protein